MNVRSEDSVQKSVLFLPHRFQELISGCHLWEQMHLPSEPSCQPYFFHIYIFQCDCEGNLVRRPEIKVFSFLISGSEIEFKQSLSIFSLTTHKTIRLEWLVHLCMQSEVQQLRWLSGTDVGTNHGWQDSRQNGRMQIRQTDIWAEYPDASACPFLSTDRRARYGCAGDRIRATVLWDLKWPRGQLWWLSLCSSANTAACNVRTRAAEQEDFPKGSALSSSNL